MKHLLSSVLTIALFLFVGNSNVHAQTPLKSFDELIEALHTGKNVRLVIHYADCMLIDDNEIKEKSPDAVGGMPLDVYEYFAKGSIKNEKAFVVSSQTKLIENPKGAGFVYNYAKVRVDEDGKVTLTAAYLYPSDYSYLMNEKFFTEINTGENNGAAYFYSD